MIGIGVGDVVAASLAAAGACLICSIPPDFMQHLVRNFPGWVVRTYGRSALLMSLLTVLVVGRLVGLGLDGQIGSPAGQAMVVAAAFLGLLLASALVRFYFNEYRKPR